MSHQCDSVIASIPLLRDWFRDMFVVASQLLESVLGGSPCLVLRLRRNCSRLTSACTLALCWSWSCESICGYGSGVPYSRKDLQTLWCSTVSGAVWKSMAATQSATRRHSV